MTPAPGGTAPAAPEVSLGRREPSTEWQMSRGFTLIEFVIVLLLLGVIAMLATPRLRGSDLDEAILVAALADTLHAARQRATAARCEVRVEVAATGVTVRQRAALCSGSFDRTAAATGAAGATLDLVAPSALPLASTRATFYFEGDGRISAVPGGPALDVAIQVGGRQLELAGATGHVTLQ